MDGMDFVARKKADSLTRQISSASLFSRQTAQHYHYTIDLPACQASCCQNTQVCIIEQKNIVKFLQFAYCIGGEIVL